MPKSVLIILCAIALGLAACKGSTSTTPTPQPAVSFTPNPNISAAVVAVTFQGSPAPHVPVSISTPLGNNTASPRPGTPFATETTRPVTKPSPGQATFKHLKPSATYCWVAQYSATISFSTCAGPVTWQYGTISLGN